MKQSTILSKSLQSIFSKNEIKALLKECRHRDTARKFTVSQLLNYWTHAAIGRWRSFRESEEQMKSCKDLVSVNHSTLSSKAAEVPYEFFKELFHRLVERCNRKTLRSLNLPTYAIDSTTITTGLGKMPWARFRGQRAGVKLHVKMSVDSLQPVQVEESPALMHDSKMASELLQESLVITIHDRGYDNYERMDQLTEQGKGFVIRLKKDTGFVHPVLLRMDTEFHEMCSQLGKSEATRTAYHYRIVSFYDLNKNLIQVATNLFHFSAEQIAEMYRSRWQVELLFRWIKQHVNVKNLFGTTPNAVYGQLFGALIAYVLLRWLYTKPALPRHLQMTSFLQFVRKLWLEKLPAEWQITLHELIYKQRYQVQCFS